MSQPAASNMIAFRAHPGLIAALRQAARRQNLSVSEFLRQAIRQHTELLDSEENHRRMATNGITGET